MMMIDGEALQPVPDRVAVRVRGTADALAVFDSLAGEGRHVFWGMARGGWFPLWWDVREGDPDWVEWFRKAYPGMRILEGAGTVGRGKEG